MRYFPSAGVPASVLPGVSREAGLVWPPCPLPVMGKGGAALNGVPLTGPAPSLPPLPARSAGATPVGVTFGTGAGVQTCCAKAGVLSSIKASSIRIGDLHFDINAGRSR